jgi:tetraacyldisaccharide 4'-kinase
MDDGHQNPSIRKALSIVVVDGETRDGEWPFGDGAVFPAGPMREPLNAGLARTDAVVVLLPADLSMVDPDLIDELGVKPVLISRLISGAPPSGPQIGFAGLGKPWKMERALRAAGCDLVEFVSLPDHATLRERFLSRLARQAADRGAGLVTSEKDWVRLPMAWRGRVVAWPVRAIFEDESALESVLASTIGPP